MATLLLRLAAPLQAWGADSKFETRKTGREPTKSGVIGLLAAALGLRRDEREALLRLTGLRFGVRVEREGQLLVDYHTAKTQDEKTSYVTYRHYLQDAVFLAGIESEDAALLQQLQQALLHPVFPLYLGRRCCPPTLPLCLGVRPGSLQEVLQAEPPLCPGRQSRILLDADPLEPGTAPQRDVRALTRIIGSTATARYGSFGRKCRTARRLRSTTRSGNCKKGARECIYHG